MNLHNIIIRQENASDIEKVFQLIEKAFQSEPYSDKDEHNLVKRLRDSNAFVPELSLVAELEGEIVGHILFTEITIGDKTALALAPVSVVPEYQGFGIGGRLIETGHEVAKSLGYGVSVVLGHEGYYPRFGYKMAKDYGIMAPFDVPDENFMVLELKEKALENMEGTVQYAPEFFQ